jgi:hypothetical protein
MALTLALGLLATPSHAEEGSSRLVAALPFGAGQVQRGDLRLGAFFGVGEGLLGGASLAALVWIEALSHRSNQRESERQALNNELKTATMVNRFSFAGWATLTAAGIVEAQVNVGRRRPAARDASPPLRLTAEPLPGGAALGLRFAF